eukprot:4764762-Pleurochrysis_carterae.AAC.1
MSSLYGNSYHGSMCSSRLVAARRGMESGDGTFGRSRTSLNLYPECRMSASRCASDTATACLTPWQWRSMLTCCAIIQDKAHNSFRRSARAHSNGQLWHCGRKNV